MKIKNVFLNRLKYNLYFKINKTKLGFYEEKNNLDESEYIICEELQNSNLKIGLVKDVDSEPYYTKFEKFLKNNKADYKYFNIYGSNWLNEAKEFDVIIWRPSSEPWQLEDAREKIMILEEFMGKKVYPRAKDIMFYENKVFQYNVLKSQGFPVIDTFITVDYDEAIEKIKTLNYPVISKIKAGSGSAGVVKIKNISQAKKHVEAVFGAGEKSYWPFVRQKNYVYLQNMIPNKGFDLRITVIDENNIFGYFRMVPKDDFRASGFGEVVKMELPKEAVKIALDIKEKLGFYCISVDFLQSEIDNKFYIIEASNFIRVDTPKQLEINGSSGVYSFDRIKDELKFTEGDFWIQELTLKNFFKDILKIVN